MCVGLCDHTTAIQGKSVLDEGSLLLFNTDEHTATLLHPLLSRTEGNKKMGREGKAVGLRQKQLSERKAKAVQQQKEERTNCLSPISKRCSSTSWEAGPQYAYLFLRETLL